MPTMTLSMRLPKQELNHLFNAANDSGMERSAFLKSALRRGAHSLMIERAAQAYREGTVTLSRAAEMAGMSQHDFITRMPSAHLELNYTTEDLAQDLRP